MVGVLILSHGCLARELLAAARQIAGELPHFRALCLDWDESREAAQGRVCDAAEALDSGDGVIILTDVFGGTPHNLAKCSGEAGRVAVVSGVNLPMVLRLGCSQSAETGLEALAKAVEARGRASILCSLEAAEDTPASLAEDGRQRRRARG